MLIARRVLSRWREERGFTLIETLVAMVTGVVVTGALFAILEFAVDQTSLISQRAQATQVSRTAMTHIVDELHSACLSSGLSPVQAGSTPTKLIFANGYSEEAEVPSTFTSKGGSTEKKSEGVRLDTIEWNEAKDYLLDTVQLGEGSGAEAGAYKFAKPGTVVRLAEGVTAETHFNAETKKSENLPIFRYYEYAPSSSTGTGEAASTLKEIPPKELKATEAESVASVQIEYRTSPLRKERKLGISAESTAPVTLTSQTTFAFSAPNSESKIEAGPCE